MYLEFTGPAATFIRDFKMAIRTNPNLVNILDGNKSENAPSAISTPPPVPPSATFQKPPIAVSVDGSTNKGAKYPELKKVV